MCGILQENILRHITIAISFTQNQFVIHIYNYKFFFFFDRLLLYFLVDTIKN